VTLELDWLVWWVRKASHWVRLVFNQQMWHWTNHGVVSWGKGLVRRSTTSTICLLIKGKRAGCIYIVPRIESVKGFKSCLPVENPNALSNFLEQMPILCICEAAHGSVSYVPQNLWSRLMGPSVYLYLAEAAWVLTSSSRCRWIWIWVPTSDSSFCNDVFLDRFGGDNWKWVLWLCLDMCRTPHNPCF
jgi:hypothetical protein